MTHSVPTRRSSDLAGRCGADLVLRFERNTLCFETAMIDADIDVEFGKTGVDMIRPALAPLLDKMGSVPVADLRAQPVFAHLAHGEHDMRRSAARRAGTECVSTCRSRCERSH